MLKKQFVVNDAVTHENVFVRGLGDIGNTFPPHTAKSFECKMFLVAGANMLVELKKILNAKATGPLFTVLIPNPNIKNMVIGEAVPEEKVAVSGKAKATT
jgi:hypothetical protein